MKKLLPFVLFLIALSLSIYAQGKIFTKAEADELFGPVKNKIRFSSKVLESYAQENDYVMFRYAKDKVNILGNNRSPLFKQFDVKDNDVYFVFGSDVVKELLSLGGEDDTYIEQRDSTISLSNGTYVGEEDTWCPPCCPDCPD